MSLSGWRFSWRCHSCAGGVQALSDLAVASQEVSFERGAPLFDRGIQRDRIYVVLEGEIEASRAAPDLVRTAGPSKHKN